jgi:hypothetical protein
MTADLTSVLLVAKYASRNVYGVIRHEPDQDELVKLLNRQMILQILSDDSCLEGLTTAESDLLESTLILKS